MESPEEAAFFATVKAGDIVVVAYKNKLSPMAQDRIREMFEDTLGEAGVTVLITDDVESVLTVRPEEVE